MRKLVQILLCAIVAGIVLGGHDAAAAEAGGDKAAARTHAMRGVALYKRGQYAAAVKALTKAEEAFHAPPHLLFMARCKRELGELREAHDLFIQVLIDQLAADAPKAFVRAQEQAGGEAAALRPRIATVLIEIKGASRDEVEVAVDGKAVSPPKLEHPIAITTGEHQITAGRQGATPAEHTVSGRVGVTQTVMLDLTPEDGADLYDVMDAVISDDEMDTDEPPDEPLDWPVWPTVTTGAGVAIVVVGAILGGVTLGEAGDIKDQCRDDICPTELAEDGDSAEAMGHASTALFIIGGVVTAAGATWLTIDLLSDSEDGDAPAAAVRTELGPTSARLKLVW
jgi:tetratricopeptide (TPR) repeat protein